MHDAGTHSILHLPIAVKLPYVSSPVLFTTARNVFLHSIIATAYGRCVL